MDINTITETLLQLLREYSVKIAAAVLIFIIGRWFSSHITLLIKKIFNKNNVDLTTGKFLENIIYYTLMVGVIIAAANQLGINTTSFLTILGAAGLAIGLALKDSLSNFASGIMLVLFPPYKVGDSVLAAGISGKVDAINIFNTIINTADNRRVYVPNSKITGGIITNMSANSKRRIEIVVGISYDDDIIKAKSVLNTLLSNETRILSDPAPNIYLTELGNSSVNISIRPWVKKEDYFSVTCDLNEMIKLSFDKEKIHMPYPTQDINIIKK